MPSDFDIIVIGSGAGGGTVAHRCARAGKNVLLIERGDRPTAGQHIHDERATLIEKRPYDDRTVRINGVLRRLYVGGGLGGGTALYGAALMHPSPRISTRDNPMGPVSPHPLGVAHHLRNAGALLHRSRAALSRVGPRHGRLRSARQAARRLPRRPHAAAPDQSPADGRQRPKRGLKPFRLPLAIDRQRCLGCGCCAGYLCPTGRGSPRPSCSIPPPPSPAGPRC